MPPNPEKCKQIISQIQGLSPLEMDELFKIIHRSSCEYTTNNNGVFINLSWVSDETLAKIEDFIKFCHQSSTELEKFEVIRSEYKQDILDFRQLPDPAISKPYIPEVKDILESDEVAPEPAVIIKPKVSSTMKFYLLKKKYSKSMASTIYTENELMHESYVIS